MHEPHGLETIHARHEHIDDEQMELSGLKQSQTGLTVIDSLNGMRGALKQQFDSAQNRSIIINDENARHGSPPNNLATTSTQGYIFVNTA